MATTVQPAVSAAAARAEQRPLNAWMRWLMPSFSDVLMIAIVAVMFMRAAGWSTLLGDGDTGWHIRTGEYILKTFSVPHQDLFSFTKAGEPWFAWEWLTDIAWA